MRRFLVLVTKKCRIYAAFGVSQTPKPYVMTKGGPQNSTRTMVYYVYEQGLQKRNFGYACAVAAIFFVIVVILSLGMKKLIKAD